MPCIVADTLNAIDSTGALVGLAGRPIIARCSAVPLSITLDGGATWHELQGNEIRTESAEDGSWSLTLFAHSEEDPNTTDWQIILPDGIAWGGTIPANVSGPVTLAQLKNTYGWAIANATSLPTVLITGPAGAPGALIRLSDSVLSAQQTSPWTIPIAAGSRHVLVELALRSTDTSGSGAVLSVQLNGKTTGYDRLDSASATYLNSPAGAYATGTFTIVSADQASDLLSIYTQMISLWGPTPSLSRTIENAYLTNAGALSSLTLLLSAGSFAIGSRVTIYGFN